ncbi:MAG: hypothetical protein ACOCZV_01305 [Nanoarchaeota archaeon]
MNRITKIVLESILAGTLACSAMTGYSQQDKYELSAREPEVLDRIVEQEANRQGLSDAQIDSTTGHWLSLYKRTGGAHKEYKDRERVVESDTNRQVLSGEKGSLLTIIQSDKITTENQVSNRVVRTYDLGSFSMWAREHEVPEYARDAIFKGLISYSNRDQSSQGDDKTGQRTEYDIQSSMEKRYCRGSSAHPDKMTASEDEVQQEANPEKDAARKWTASIYYGFRKNGDCLELGISRDILESEDFTVRLKLQGILGSEYRVTRKKEDMTSTYEGGYLHDKTRYERLDRKVSTVTNKRISTPASLSVGARLNEKNDLKITMYGGASLISTEKGISETTICESYYTLVPDKKQVGYELIDNRREKGGAQTISYKPFVGISIDHDIIGVGATYRPLPDGKRKWSVGANFNF